MIREFHGLGKKIPGRTTTGITNLGWTGENKLERMPIGFRTFLWLQLNLDLIEALDLGLTDFLSSVFVPLSILF